MEKPKLNVVTGASGYTGKYITRRLLAQGEEVINLTGHPDRPHEFGSRVRSIPFNFGRPDVLRDSLRGVDTLFNTYWVRFARKGVTYDLAVKNTKTLILAAKEAGVRRFVHTSICNPSESSPLPYYKGKADLERSLRESGLSYAILRPTVIFGKEDILINNIAWFVRTFPVFAVPGSGRYRLQPIYVEDMATLAVEVGQGKENIILDAVGPETFTFDDLVRLIAAKIGRKTGLIHLPGTLVFVLTSLMGRFIGDTVLTWEEVKGLLDDLLASSQPPTGATRFSEWLEGNAEALGLEYSSEVARHFKRG
jgi:uncharacterized protein YbjT (DUF2867 family)